MDGRPLRSLWRPNHEDHVGARLVEATEMVVQRTAVACDVSSGNAPCHDGHVGLLAGSEQGDATARRRVRRDSVTDCSGVDDLELRVRRVMRHDAARHTWRLG